MKMFVLKTNRCNEISSIHKMVKICQYMEKPMQGFSQRWELERNCELLPAGSWCIGGLWSPGPRVIYKLAVETVYNDTPATVKLLPVSEQLWISYSFVTLACLWHKRWGSAYGRVCRLLIGRWLHDSVFEATTRFGGESSRSHKNDTDGHYRESW